MCVFILKGKLSQCVSHCPPCVQIFQSALMKTKQLWNRLSGIIGVNYLNAFDLNWRHMMHTKYYVSSVIQQMMKKTHTHTRKKNHYLSGTFYLDGLALRQKHVKYHCILLCPHGAVSIILSTWLLLTWDESRRIRDTACGSC